MATGSIRSRRDIALGIAIIVFSALVYWQALGLPPPRYEPMGSAALPKALSVIMAALALIVIVRALRGQPPADAGSEAEAVTASATSTATATVASSAPSAPSAPSPPAVVRRPWLAVFTFAACVAYVAVLDNKLLGYSTATIAFLGMTCLLLTRGDWRQWRWILPFAVGLSLLCYFVFTRIFYIDLG